MGQDLKIIKKKYGEKMAHLCREFFPTLLESEGLLLKLMLNNFEPNHDLYDDIINQKKEDEFKNYIYSLANIENNKGINVDKSPKELLDKAGYDLYECKSEEDIQSFRKYYAPGEALCTFKGDRLDRCYVFFAVKKNVNNINRENFKNPQRQDEYGTSVISIQFDRSDAHTLSIKNRYNHTVNNPDNTFGSNLDNIIDGLTESFGKFYGLVQQHPNGELELEGYVRARDGKYYKYNQEHYHIYYCPNNIIIDSFEAKKYDKEKYIIFEYFILDLVKKEVKLYDEKNMEDSFPSTISNIQRIEVKRIEDKKEIKITLQDKSEVIIVLDKDNKIIKLENPNLKVVGDYFLVYASSLQDLNMPNLEKVGREFLARNNIKKLGLPLLKKVGDDFLRGSIILEELESPSLEEVGNNFLYFNESISKLNLPKLRKVGHNFLYYNESVKEFLAPFLEKVDSNFLFQNTELKNLTLPALEEVGNSFLNSNLLLKSLNLPSLKKVGDSFLSSNKFLEEVNLPKLRKVGCNFLHSNLSLEELELPSLEEASDNFLIYNSRMISKINLPSLQRVGSNFLGYNASLKKLSLPSLRKVEDFFLGENQNIEEFDSPLLEEVGNQFLSDNRRLKKLDLPLLKKVGRCFLSHNEDLEEVNLPSLEEVGEVFLGRHPTFTKEDFIVKFKR